MLVLGMNLIVKNLDDVADRDDSHELRITHDGDLGDVAFAHLAHDFADVVIEVAGDGVAGHQFGDAQAAKAFATGVNHAHDVSFAEHPDQMATVVDNRQRADVVLDELGDGFTHGRIGIDGDDAATLGLDDISNKHVAPPRYGACERSQRLESLPTDALDLRKGWVTMTHRDIIFRALQIIFSRHLYFRKQNESVQPRCQNHRINSFIDRPVGRNPEPDGLDSVVCGARGEYGGTDGRSFPPLAKGGSGGVGTHGFDIVNSMPCPSRRHQEARRGGLTKRPECTAIGCAETTPPKPPVARGGKNALRSPMPIGRAGMVHSYWLLAILLLATFLVRVFHADQPIVENYVGRQVPTAMVARNLDRGKGFLRPQLDTAPFPNYFLVEPPIYESGVVIIKRLSNLSLQEAGRILSALSTAGAALGLFLLARRREGAVVAYLAVATFAVFPLTIRYGRAFQPDAAMMGTVVLGLACWDQHRSVGRWYWLAAAWLLVALGLAIKITAAFLLVPLVLVIARARSLRAIIMVCSTLLPAVLWYAWAAHLLGSGEGSRASADNRAIWLGLVGLSSLVKPETLKFVVWFLLVRAFTPLGAVLALIGLAEAVWKSPQRRNRIAPGVSPVNGDALWLAWGISALVAMAFLAEKLHHEYYWLLVAPVAAVGIGRCLSWLAQSHRAVAVVAAGSLCLLSWVQVRSTWRTPAEWNGLEQAAAAIAATVAADAWVVAPEALLFQADRRGCRMEWNAAATARAAGEWESGRRVDGPLELVEYYRRQGARYFADLGCRESDLTRKGLHDAVRRRYKVIVDRPDVIIADLADSEMHWNAN